ncbi:acylphosphatase [Mucilaginibacter sp. PAMC 26640]|nr:acylphosphatase [Mucilaginibacter sp. PAMC 26640]
MKHHKITVKGKVQGVSFRAGAKAVADQLGIKGWVKNLPNGDVYLEAEGDDTMMEMFVEWCQEGAEHAVVTGIEVHDGELKNYRNFEVVKKSS